jgi:hypothetical protein
MPSGPRPSAIPEAAGRNDARGRRRKKSVDMDIATVSPEDGEYRPTIGPGVIAIGINKHESRKYRDADVSEAWCNVEIGRAMTRGAQSRCRSWYRFGRLIPADYR